MTTRRLSSSAKDTRRFVLETYVNELRLLRLKLLNFLDIQLSAAMFYIRTEILIDSV